LIISGVMNPNLSPFSKSGVALRVGQKGLFKARGKRHLLFEVDDTFKNNSTLDVPKLIRQRKEELGIRR